jgi:diguanylate cyclase (GGDEF)-like protein
MAKLLQRFVRSGDITCRYGGEEFVLICPEASVSSMVERAELLRGQIRGLRLQHFGRALEAVSASIGIAAFPSHGNSPGELLIAADRALYLAKENGRDRIELAG